MILAAHQPQYLPWVGYFHKMANSDLFVILDDVQYKKREFQNRNRIRNKDGWIWLTVPVLSKGHYDQRILEVKVDNETSWRHDHWEAIRHNYARAPHFVEHSHFFEEFYSSNISHLIDLNMTIIDFLCSKFNIRVPIRRSSELGLSSSSTQRLVDICRAYSADTYLSGIGGRDYLDEELFVAHGIKLIYQDFKHPVYTQCFPGFEPYMSAIDLLFNFGTESVVAS